MASTVVGGPGRLEPLRRIVVDLRQLSTITHNHEVAAAGHRQARRQQADLRRFVDDEVVEEVPVGDAVQQCMAGAQHHRVVLGETREL